MTKYCQGATWCVLSFISIWAKDILYSTHVVRENDSYRITPATETHAHDAENASQKHAIKCNPSIAIAHPLQNHLYCHYHAFNSQKLVWALSSTAPISQKWVKFCFCYAAIRQVHGFLASLVASISFPSAPSPVHREEHLRVGHQLLLFRNGEEGIAVVAESLPF